MACSTCQWDSPPAPAWDSGNNYVITFDRINWPNPAADNNLDRDRPDIPPGTSDAATFTIESQGVYQIRYSVTTDATGAVTGNTVTLPIFRVNTAWSAPTDSGSARYYTLWPYYQGDNQVAMDADGDITSVYDGFGSEVGYGLNLDYTFNSDLWSARQNGLSYLDAYLLNQYYPYKYPNWSSLFGTKATDAVLGDLNNALLSYYYSAYASAFNASNAVNGTLDQPNGYILGEPNGISFAQLDAFRVVNPDGSITMQYDNSGTQQDVVANSQMDGHDAQYILGIDPAATSGGFTLRITNLDTTTPGYTDLTITPTYFPNGGPVNVVETTTTIQRALAGVTARLGGVSATVTTSVLVRLIPASEVTARAGTNWDMSNLGLNLTGANTIPYQFYEILLDDQAHNWPDISMVTRDPFTMKYTGGGDANSAEIAVETTADMGTLQQFPAVAVTPGGNAVIVWTQADRYSNGQTQNSTDYNRNYPTDTSFTTNDSNNSDMGLLGTSIHFRTYTESTDTAGPLATDFSLTDGSHLSNGGEINQSLQYLVVTFDESMMTAGASSVTNPANWALMKNGTIVNGGISKIYYGLNMASQLGQWSIEDPADYAKFSSFINAPASNKYEAVIILDGNGQAAGTPVLTNGNYQVVALNSLRDAAGNPLGRTGYNINGNNFSRSFSIAIPSGSETIVNTTTSGDQTTTADVAGLASDGNGQVVASDGNGDSVVVWTSNAPGKLGIYARLYTTTWTLSGTTRVSSTVASNEILVTSDSYATNAAVAMDGDGDFVITWSSDKNDPSDTGTSWDVYAERFDSKGNAHAYQHRRHKQLHLPGQFLHPGHPTPFQRGHGRSRRLCHHLAKHEPGRQRLRSLRATLQPGRGSPGRHQRTARDKPDRQAQGHLYTALGIRRRYRQQFCHHASRVAKRSVVRRAFGPNTSRLGVLGNQLQRRRRDGADRHRNRHQFQRQIYRRGQPPAIYFSQSQPDRRCRLPNKHLHLNPGRFRRGPRERHHRRRSDGSFSCHGCPRFVRHFLDQLRPGWGRSLRVERLCQGFRGRRHFRVRHRISVQRRPDAQPGIDF